MLLQDKQETIVPLPVPIPVYVVYCTVWVDAAGVAHFRDDPYSVDRRVSVALAQSHSAGFSGGKTTTRVTFLHALD
jgi:murein L,D-transpeptidase YcbB/YkuD